MLMKVLYDMGVTYKELFFSLALMTVILWLRTFFLMPKQHIPWPVPRIGFKKRRSHSEQKANKLKRPVEEAEFPMSPNNTQTNYPFIDQNRASRWRAFLKIMFEKRHLDARFGSTKG